MHGLVIENEYSVDNSVRAFLKDNPKLFKTVKEQTFCKERPVEDLARFIVEADAIIFATTWMYIDQVREYVEAFMTGGLKDKPMQFYIHSFVATFNRWRDESSVWHDNKELRNEVIQLLEKPTIKIFDFFEQSYNDKLKKVTDTFNLFGDKRQRWPYHYFEVKYSKEHDLFYNDHEYYTLEEQIKDFGSVKKDS